MSAAKTSIGEIEKPAAHTDIPCTFGSDVVADAIRATGVPYIALTPGASFRGLHDSLVNYLGNRDPQMLVCLHEEHAVAIAQGYAKVTGRPLAVALHSNVGLMHATMAVFNAWCDRVPMLIFGATGPVDAAKRRPWIDWIHTARDQGALVRSYVKWDDQPASPTAAREAIWRGHWLACRAPAAPVYINLDVEMQEARLPAPVAAAEAPRYMPDSRYEAGAEQLRRLVELLQQSSRPLLLFGRGARTNAAWEARQQLAERLGALVLTDLKLGATFPTDHPLHVGAPTVFPSAAGNAAIASADLILSFDWVDLAGLLQTGAPDAACRIVQISVDHHIHNGWSMDHQALPPVDLHIPAEPDIVIAALAEHFPAKVVQDAHSGATAIPPLPETGGEPSVDHVAVALARLCERRPVSLVHLPISWDARFWPFRDPLDFIGGEAGGGIGGGPGVSVGAALALRGSGRLPVAITGDGDFIMGATALWTAVHYRVPMLVIVTNNKSYFNDEVHQERVARIRDRPVENRWIGQRLDDPEISIVQLAAAQGATALGPVHRLDQLSAALMAGIEAVDRGEVAVIDVRVRGEYPASVASPMSEAKE